MWFSELFKGMSPASFFNFSFLPKYGAYFLQGLGYTLLLAVVSVLLAVIPALMLAIMRLSKNKLVKGIAGAYIAAFRSTPLLVQLSIIYFGLFGAITIPRVTVFGFLDISRFIPGVVALALNSSAYVAEIFRAGILAVDVGQTEAARSLGLNGFQSMRLIVLPLIMLFGLYLLGVRGSLLVSCVISASAPVAAISTMFATKYDGEARLSASCVASSTLLSIVTMTFIVGLASWLA